MKWKLVYFDDQPLNIECYQEYFNDHFDVIGVTDSTQFSEVLQRVNPHLYLIDVHMPKMNGFLLCQEILSHPSYNNCPIIFISGDDTDENKIRSYEGGGVDFIPRNLNPEEINIRLISKVKVFFENSLNFSLGNLSLQLKSLVILIDGEMIDLTLIELRILSHILRAYPHPLSRKDLIQIVWEHDPVKAGTINTHLTNLKSKIKEWDYQIKVRDEHILIIPKLNLNNAQKRHGEFLV